MIRDNFCSCASHAAGRSPHSYTKHPLRLLLCLLVGCSLVWLGGCAPDKKVKNAQVFFTAFNHLLEADTLSVKGHFEMGQIASDYTFMLDQEDEINLALVLGSPADPASAIQFYIKDGRTYLDYLGTTSQSLAENIGIDPDTKLDFYNPFLDYTDDQRADFFKSITVSNDGTTYTFDIDPTTVGLLLDSLGSARVGSAVMVVRFDDNQIQSLDLNISGLIVMGTSQADLHIVWTMDVLSMNQPVQIDWPDNLDQYGENEQAEADLLESALS